MTGRTIARILLAIVLIGGALTLGIGAYNAGVTAGLAQTGQVVVANGPYLAPAGAYVGYGWGWGHGFGFFGFLGGLLFLFLLIGLIRAAFGGPRRGWGPGTARATAGAATGRAGRARPTTPGTASIRTGPTARTRRADRAPDRRSRPRLAHDAGSRTGPASASLP